MGLFDLFKKKEPEKPKRGYEPQDLEELWVNITSKQLKIPVESKSAGSAYMKGGYLWEEEKLIKLMDGDDVIFEVTPRSKAFNELKPWARQKLWDATIYQKQGDYGEFFRARLRRTKNKG